MLFVIFVGNIVVMNVFTGLAVGDVESVMTEASFIKARYQMKLVANMRAHPFLRWRRHSSKMTLKLIRSEDYSTVKRWRNIFRKHYLTTTTTYLLKQEKFATWLQERDDFAPASEPIATDKTVQRVEAKVETLTRQVNQIQSDLTNIIKLIQGNYEQSSERKISQH